jgi:hypothetical protein
VIASPDAYTVYQISRELPLEAQRLRIVAVGPPGLHDVTIYLDSQALATSGNPPFEAWWVLEAGDHTVTATGITAAGEVIASDARLFQVNPPD